MLKNKNVLVVGGAGLLGRRISSACIDAGANVVIADRNIDSAASGAKELGALATHIDISCKESINSSLALVTDAFGSVDAVVNSAYPRNAQYGRKFEDVEYSDFCENVGLHLGGYFQVSQQAALFMSKQGHGTILNMSSIYGVVPPRFDIYNQTKMTMPVEYAAIKSSLIHLTKYIAKYMAGKNVRINCISLGGLLDGQPESFVAAYNKYAVNKGMLDPQDITGTICFMLSDLATYINGQNIIVDDGWTL